MYLHCGKVLIRLNRQFILAVFLILPYFTPLSGQDGSASPNASNPKVGLVLSGGGAKALAQVGALKVIDSLGIKIDYVSGTSMGAIVGAMYALGYPVAEIERQLKEVDWEALLSNEIPRRHLSYFDRKDEDRYLLAFPILDGRITLPTGFNYSHYILKQLSYLTQRANRYDDFSQYPIPFTCAVTNLVKGEVVYLESGELSDALRASSAFPSLFTPYEIEGQLYADGGILDNYPVQPLLDKGVDIIIGVDVQDVLYDKEELNSVVRILEQTSSFKRVEEYQRQLRNTDILIKPEITGAGITSFERFAEIVDSGKVAAQKMLPQLQAILNIDTARARPRDSATTAPLRQFGINKIVVSGHENYTAKFITGKLNIKEGAVTTITKLERGLDQLYGSRLFEKVDYQLIPEDSAFNLHLEVREVRSLSQFQVGIHYDDDFKTALLLNFTKRNLLFKNSRLSFDVAVGDNPRARLHYFVDHGVIPTLGVNVRANRFETTLYENRRRLTNLNYFDFSTDFFIQSTFYDALAIGAGIQFEGVDLKQQIEVTDYIDSYNNYFNYYFFLDFDSFNDLNYPRSGSQVSANFRIINQQKDITDLLEPTSVFDAKLSQAARLGKDFSLVATARGALTIGPDPDYPYQVFLGSMGKNYINYIYPFVGYRFMELSGRNALMLRGDLYYEFFKNHYLIGRYNLGRLEPALDQLLDSETLFDGYSLGYSFNSPIGPLELHVMSSTNHSDWYTYLALGFWF